MQTTSLTPELLKSRVKLLDVAVISYDLGLWYQDVDDELEAAYKGALAQSPDSFVNVWNQLPQSRERFPSALEEHVRNRLDASRRRHSASWVAHFVVKVLANQTRLYEHGYPAYADVCRRLQAVLLTVMPSETDAVDQNVSFATNISRVNEDRHEEDYIVAAATVIVATVFLSKRPTRTRAQLKGSLTAVPIDWTPVELVRTAVCDQGMGEPYAEYALLLHNQSVAFVNTEAGVHSSMSLTVDGDALLWIAATPGNLYAASATCLYEFTPGATQRFKLSPLPTSNRMDKSVPNVTFQVPRSNKLATLCLASKKLSFSPHEADSVRSDARHAPGAFRNHVYLHGTVLASLPREQRVVSAYIVDRVLDVFTESNDWWRINLDTMCALVAGLDVAATVVDATPSTGIQLGVEAAMRRMNIQ